MIAVLTVVGAALGAALGWRGGTLLRRLAREDADSVALRPAGLILGLAALGALAAPAATAAGGQRWWPVTLLVLLSAGAACAVDLAAHRLPDVLVLRGWAAAVVAVIVTATTAGEPRRLLTVVGASALCFALLAIVAWIHPPGMGYGDVKLAGLLGVLGGLGGVPAALVALALAFVLGGVVAVVLLLGRRATRRSALPFGPFLLLGTLAVAVAPAFTS